MNSEGFQLPYQTTCHGTITSTGPDEVESAGCVNAPVRFGRERESARTPSYLTIKVRKR